MTEKELLEVIRKAKRTGVTELDLSRNELQSLPDEIWNLTNLTTLNLSRNQLTALPEAIGNLTNLTKLNLNYNQITAIPDSLAELTNLKELYLNSNQITAIPDSLANLTNLTALYLYSNQITAIPDSLAKLTNLTTLYLSDNQITAIPDSLAELTNLKELYLNSNQITAIPDSLANLTNLTTLYLSDNQITAIPDSLANLTNLTTLYLSDNQITAIPDSLANLTNLTELYLSSNQITAIPDSLAKLNNLTELNLYSNQITAIPDSLAELTNLKELYLNSNQITTIPDSLAKLTNLTTLYLSDNQITAIPDSLAELTNLKELYLNSNQITTIPDSLAKLTKLTALGLSNNPLDYPPEIASEEGMAILRYVRNLKAGETKRYESKLIIVGQGGVGKTCLSRALRGLRFKKQVTTYGVEVQKMTMKHPSLPKQKVMINLWDFGGQEIAHSTHQFFLTERSLYLLVFNARLEADAGRLDYWLDTIRARAPKAKVLLVATQCFERTPKLDYGRLKGRYPELLVEDDYLRVDSNNGTGIKGLKQTICRHICTLELMGHSWPKSYAAIEKEIERRTEQKEAYCDRDVIYKAMAEAGLTDKANQDGLARVLGDLGKITHFPNSLQLHNHIILSPQWLTHAISIALEHPPLDAAHGVLEHRWLLDLWKKDYSGLHAMFHRCMEEFEICYPIEGDATRSLVPLRFPPAKPPINWSNDPNRITRRLIYRFQFVPAGVMARFIVKTYRMTTGVYWEYGVFLRKGEAEALCEHDYQKREISIEVRSVYPQNFLERLCEYLESILDEYKGLPPKILLSCIGEPDNIPECSGEFPYKALLDAIHHGHETIRCFESGHDVKTLDLVYGLQVFADQREVLRSILSLVKDNAKRGEVIEQQLREMLNWMWKTEMEIYKRCPSLISITSADRSRRRPADWTGQWYRLHLFCQSEEIHLVDYVREFKKTAKWWTDVRPYLERMALLAWVAAGTTSVAVSGSPAAVHWAAAAQALEPMHTFLNTIGVRPDQGRGIPEQQYDYPVERGGSSLRAIANLLDELDPNQTWKDILTPVKTPDGKIRWLCKAHLDKYLPPEAKF